MKDTKPSADRPKPPPIDPYDVLRAFVDAVEAATDKASRDAAARKHRPMGAAYDAVARLAMPEGDPAWVDGEIARLRAVDGMASASKEFHRGLIARGKAIKKAPHLRVADPEEGEAPDLASPYDVRPPPGYLIDGAGVYKLVASQDGSVNPIRIADGPLLLIGLSKDVATEDMNSTLAWRDGERWVEEIVPRHTCCDPRALVALSARGAPIVGPRSGEVVLYLSAAEAACELPRESTTPRMGWVDGSLVVGRSVYRSKNATGADIIFRPDAGSAQLAGHYRTHGTWAGWLEAWALVSRHPIAAASVYVACAAPFLHILGENGFVVDWSARPGSGKTTALRLGSSVWGEPTESGQIKSWSSTQTFIERLAWTNCDLPIYLDDTNRVPQGQRETLSQIIYALSNGVAKGRGTVTGTASTQSWRTVALSTGEARLTSYTQEAGAHARVISLTGYPLGAGKEARGAERSEAIRALVEANYGHLGAKLAAWLVSTDHARIRVRHGEILQKYTAAEQLPNATARRFSPRVALLELVKAILHGPMGLPLPEVDPIAEIWRQVRAETEEADMPAEALRHLYQHAVAQPGRFYGRNATDSGGQDLPPLAGWLGSWASGDQWDLIGFMPKDARQILERGKYAVDLILSEWKARGWLKAEDKGLTYKMPMQHQRERMLAIRRSALVKVGVVENDVAAWPGGEK